MVKIGTNDLIWGISGKRGNLMDILDYMISDVVRGGVFISVGCSFGSRECVDVPGMCFQGVLTNLGSFPILLRQGNLAWFLMIVCAGKAFLNFSDLLHKCLVVLSSVSECPILSSFCVYCSFGEIPVTNENKAEYVQLLIQNRLTDLVRIFWETDINIYSFFYCSLYCIFRKKKNYAQITEKKKKLCKQENKGKKGLNQHDQCCIGCMTNISSTGARLYWVGCPRLNRFGQNNVDQSLCCIDPGCPCVEPGQVPGVLLSLPLCCWELLLHWFGLMMGRCPIKLAANLPKSSRHRFALGDMWQCYIDLYALTQHCADVVLDAVELLLGDCPPG
ncbi:hypothetical protein VP01_1722g1 [Puccinia sorghi]|uniref:Uncharacterized protein n=1 Tax=Puccinia sorghi TaxID=27349 RepID=A0A0L6VFF5_9BASI|nr:hypothetical protein VP01_1722g1 [Puccinia sorghi]